jgi:hypothetical protein
MDPIPTPLAPEARAMGAVTSVKPDEHITGILTARDNENAVSIVSCTSKLARLTEIIPFGLYNIGSTFTSSFC